MALKVAFSAGEVSGDEHAARLCLALRSRLAGVEISGMGGSNLRAAGCRTVVDSEATGSVMGAQELFSKLRKISQSFKEMKRLLIEWRPELLILIDYPDFNLRLAKVAKSLGIKTVYFIIPKMWAWRSGRVKQFIRHIDLAATIFPFEGAFLSQNGYERSVYVGHPFSSDNKFAQARIERVGFLRNLGASSERPVLTVLLGSRESEVRSHLNCIREGLSIIQRDIPELQILLPLTSNIPLEHISRELKGIKNTFLFHGDSIHAMAAGDVGLIKSGTSNLQAVFCDLPFVMFYKLGRVSAAIARLLIPLKEYSIVNILRKGSVEELVQERLTGAEISSEIISLLKEAEARNRMAGAFSEIRELLSSHDDLPILNSCETPYDRVAELSIDLLNK